MDKDQVSEILSRSFGENSVESFTVTPACSSNENFTTTVFFITVELKDRKDPIHLVCKIYPHHPARQNLLNLTKIFQREIIIYEKVFPEFIKFQEEILRLNPLDVIHLPIPRFYSGFCSIDIKDASHNYILLEGLFKEDFHVKARTEPFDMKSCSLVISQLAKFHALSYAYTLHSGHGQKLTDFFPELAESIFTAENEKFMKEMITSNVAHCIKIIEKHHGLDSPEYEIAAKLGNNPHLIIVHYLTSLQPFMSFKELSRTKPRLFAEDKEDVKNSYYFHNFANNDDDNEECMKDEEWLVLTHGDCWMGNFLFRSFGGIEEVALVDFQMMREVSLTIDLVFLLVVNGTKEFREENTGRVLKEYYEAFGEICKKLKVEPWRDFSLELLKEKYENTLLWGYAVAFFVLPIIWATPNQGDLDGIKEDVDSKDVYREMIKMNGVENEVLKRKVLEIVDEMIQYQTMIF